MPDEPLTPEQGAASLPSPTPSNLYASMPLGLVIRRVCLYYRSLNIHEIPDGSNCGPGFPGLAPGFRGGIDVWTHRTPEPWCGCVAKGIENEATFLKFGKSEDLAAPSNRGIYPSVRATAQWAKDAGLWISAGSILVDATPLCIGARVIFKHSHTGLVTGLVKNLKGQVTLVVVDAGNHSNRFGPKLYALSDIAGFIVSRRLLEEPVYEVKDVLVGVEGAGGIERTR